MFPDHSYVLLHHLVTTDGKLVLSVVQVCLEQTVKLVARRRSLRKTALDAIPEDDEGAKFYREVHGDFYEKEVSFLVSASSFL